jgi:hypothetical protein
MNASELRVGNYIEDCFDIKNLQVIQLDLEDFAVMLNYRNSNHPMPYKGVKLSNDWVNKFGIPTTDSKFMFVINGVVSKEFEFVHELQNFYYAITGSELNVLKNN